ncbi:uncharacterized protein BDCG_08343 [Blastomyces dermatitidis ER-3]|uniref:Uncharacterized protein n=1 Tax=Ajellomyces dermatitidis (strain ER-3 / ATCC MYA-2586) TaxID=559297 RepID=A0ABP2EPW4_AJEDR|nr:uncharacterized protein BDCG_08343 [Blastomyces dermatitidis ER-3]EEQ85074.1 hypothetical protein BDCG_08343 [Blastomyces dermatitidis ER-3]
MKFMISAASLESYVIILTERGGSVAMMMREAESELNADTSAGRRNNTSLQDTVTITAAVREAEEEEEEENVIMRVMLLQLIDVTVSVFNLTFLTVMKTAATP